MVSICIPTYNGEKYIHGCLNSVLAQSFHDIEIMIVDDGSSDLTISIIEAYQRKDARIKLYINTKNLGLVSNWNKCIEYAQGQWIKFVFQDDILHIDCSEKMMLHTSESNFIVCKREFIIEKDVSSDVHLFFTKQVLTLNNITIDTYFTNKQFCELALEFYLKNFIGEPSNVLFNKSAVYQIGGFNKNPIQVCDLEYWLRLGTTYGMFYIPETLAYFRVHGSSTTSFNQIKKGFKKKYVDSIILQHDIAFNPNYQFFRKINSLRDVPIHIEQALEKRLVNAIVESSKDKKEVTQNDLHELYENYPILKHLKEKLTNNYFNKFIFALRRIVSKIKITLLL